MTTAVETVTPEALQFAERLGLGDALHRSFELVREHFPEARRIVAEVMADPDAREEWISLGVDVPSTIPDLVVRDDALLAAWIEAIDWSAARHLTVMIYPVSLDGPA